MAELSTGLEAYRAGQTGLLRLTWDNGDRTVLVNPELGGVTLGWNLTHTAQDELFAAIEGTAFHTRIILERMAEHGVADQPRHQRRRHPAEERSAQPASTRTCSTSRCWCRSDEVTSLGSAIFAFLAAGAFNTIEDAQDALCPPYRTIEPDPAENAACEQLYGWYRQLYFGMGRPDSQPIAMGEVLPGLRHLAAHVRRMAAAG